LAFTHCGYQQTATAAITLILVAGRCCFGYHIVLPEGTFTYTLDGATVKTQAIDETIIIKSDTTSNVDPDNPTPSGDFADFDYTLSVNPNAGTSISDPDLNNFTLSLYK